MHNFFFLYDYEPFTQNKKDFVTTHLKMSGSLTKNKVLTFKKAKLYNIGLPFDFCNESTSSAIQQLFLDQLYSLSGPANKPPLIGYFESHFFLKAFCGTCQEMGAIAPAPVNARKMIRGAPRDQKSLSHFIHFQLQVLPHMPSNSIKCKGNLGKIIPVALKYLIYAMQYSPI
jgi:hypothetical protein